MLRWGTAPIGALVHVCLLIACTGRDRDRPPPVEPLPDAGAADAGATDAGEPDPCAAGCGPEVVASGQDHPTGIAVNDTHVVWTNEGATSGDPTGSIAICPIDGCAEVGPRFLYTGLGMPFSPILDGDAVYFVHGVLGTAGGSITGFVPERGTLDGADLGLPILWWGSMKNVAALGMTDGQVYFAMRETAGSFVARCPTSGCPDDGTSVYLLAEDVAGASALLVDEGSVYYTEVGTARLVRTARGDGSGATTLHEPMIGVRVLAQDDTHVYWGTTVLEEDNPDLDIQNYVGRVAKSGGDEERLADLGAVVGMTVSGDHVYVADRTGTLYRLPKTGGALEPIADGQDLPFSLAVSGDYLYWANYWDGRIMRLRL